MPIISLRGRRLQVPKDRAGIISAIEYKNINSFLNVLQHLLALYVYAPKEYRKNIIESFHACCRSIRPGALRITTNTYEEKLISRMCVNTQTDPHHNNERTQYGVQRSYTSFAVRSKKKLLMNTRSWYLEGLPGMQRE